MRGLITRNTAVLLVRAVIDETGAALGYRFRRERMRTSRVLAVTRRARRQTGEIFRRAARVISSGIWFALLSRRVRFEWALVTRVMMRLRS
jgi:hypothetical protein